MFPLNRECPNQREATNSALAIQRTEGECGGWTGNACAFIDAYTFIRDDRPHDVRGWAGWK
jgi:hypothetical protein